MSEISTPSLPAVAPESVHRQGRAQFIEWALAQLGLHAEREGRDLIVDLPEADRAAFGGQPQLRLVSADHADGGEAGLALDGPVGRWLIGRLQARGPAVHARPRRQPMAVNEIAALLFPAYEVEKGQVHISGCQLTDHPFLRLSYGGEDEADAVRHVYVAPDGSPLADGLVAKLGLDELQPIVQLPPRLDEGAVRSLIAAGRRIAAKQSALDEASVAIAEPLVATVLWVRHAEGRLQFTIGKSTATLPFSGWAKLLKPPPFVGKYTGRSAFKLAATDDGRIDAAEEIATCQESGRRVLRQELVECSVTGKQVLEEFTEVCPVSGRPALRSTLVTCTSCRQRVSSGVMEGGACEACRTMANVTKDDPRLVWIFTEHPGLDRWKHWQLAETLCCYVAQAAGWWRRLLVVVDKETLAVRRLATADRVSKKWIDAAEPLAAELLK